MKPTVSHKNFKIAGAVLTLIATVFAMGCNATGGIDSPSTRTENIQAARIALDKGDCNEAARLATDISDPDDSVRYVQGWAKLCQGGATFTRVATLLDFSSTSNSVTLVASLATKMLPTSEETKNYAEEAAQIFTRMVSTKERAVNVGLAKLTKAAAILGKASNNKVDLLRSDIAPGACQGTCPGNASNCTTRNMSDSDALAFYDAITDAASAVNGQTGLGNAKSIIDTLRTTFPNAVGDQIRCQIFNTVLTR